MNRITEFGDCIKQLRKQNNMTLRQFFINSKIDDILSWSRSESGFMPPPSNDEIINALSIFDLGEKEINEILERADLDRKNFKLISEEDFVLAHLPAFPPKESSAENIINCLKEEYNEIVKISQERIKK